MDALIAAVTAAVSILCSPDPCIKIEGFNSPAAPTQVEQAAPETHINKDINNDPERTDQRKDN